MEGIWAWDSDNEVWVQVKTDSQGRLYTVAVIDNLNDIGDVNAGSPSDQAALVWDNATSKWIPVLMLPLAGGTMTGAIAMGGSKITGLGAPAAAGDAARKTETDLLTLLTTFNDHDTRHENGGDDEMSVAGLSGQLADDQHIVDAEAVSAVEAAGLALASGKNIKVVQALTADHTWSGLTATMTAGTGLTIGQAVYVGGDSKMEKALATGTATMPAIALATGTISENATGEFLMQGFFRDDTWNWTIGGLLYVDEDTAGALTQTLPAGAGEQVQVVGIAISADIIYFSPSFELVEIAA